MAERWQDAAGGPVIFSPIIRIDFGHRHAFVFGGMHKFRPAQINTHMPRIGRRFEEHQVAGPKVMIRYRLPLPDLQAGAARQFNVTNISVDRFDKPGAIDSLPISAPQAMPDSLPASVLLTQLFLDCHVNSMPFGYLRRRRSRRCHAGRFGSRRTSDYQCKGCQGE